MVEGTPLLREHPGINLDRGFESLLLRQGNNLHAPVAQLDRVLGYEPRGQEFESLRAHQYKQGVSLTASSFFISKFRSGVNSGVNQKIARTQIFIIKML